MKTIRVILLICIYCGSFNSYPQFIDSLFIKEVSTLNANERIVYCSEAIEQNPEALMFFCRGEAYFYQLKYSEAIYDFTQAISLKSDYADAFFQRSCSNAEINRCDDALDDYVQALKFKHDLYKELYDPFCSLLNLNKCDSIHEKLQVFLALNPDNSSLFILRGLLFEMVNNDSAALENYNKAIKINSALDLIYSRCGFIFMHSRNYEDAIIEFSKAVRYSPNNAEYLFELGMSQSIANYFDLALMNFQKAYQRSPSSKIYTHIGLCYMGKDKYKEAKSIFESAIKMDSSDFRPYLALAGLLNIQGNTKQAIQYANKALVIEPKLENIDTMEYKDILFLFYKDIDEIDPLSFFRSQSDEFFH